MNSLHEILAQSKYLIVSFGKVVKHLLRYLGVVKPQRLDLAMPLSPTLVVDSGFTGLYAALLRSKFQDLNIVVENIGRYADTVEFSLSITTLLNALGFRDGEVVFVDNEKQAQNLASDPRYFFIGPVSSRILQKSRPWQKCFIEHGLSDVACRSANKTHWSVAFKRFILILAGRYSAGISNYEALSVFKVDDVNGLNIQSLGGFSEGIRGMLKEEFRNLRELDLMLAFSPWESHRRSFKFEKAEIERRNLRLLESYFQKDRLTVVKFHPSLSRHSIRGNEVVDRLNDAGYRVLLFEELFESALSRFWPIEILAVVSDVKNVYGDFSSACVTLSFLGASSVRSPLSWFHNDLLTDELAQVQIAREMIDFRKFRFD